VGIALSNDRMKSIARDFCVARAIKTRNNIVKKTLTAIAEHLPWPFLPR